MLGLHDECVENVFHKVFGCNLQNYHVGKIMAFAPLHFLKHGEGEKTLKLAFQGVQRVQLSGGATPKEAATFADAAYRGMAVHLARIARATPAKLLHASWCARTLGRPHSHSRHHAAALTLTRPITAGRTRPSLATSRARAARRSRPANSRSRAFATRGTSWTS